MKNNRLLRSGRRQGGFTLLELMVTVVIVSIISAVAYPSYASYVVRTNRAAAASCLTEMSQFMERVYLANLRYDQNNGTGTALPALQCTRDTSTRYTYGFATGTLAQRGFRLQATPQGSQATKDTQCATLSLDQTGLKAISGSGTAAACWR